MPAPSCQTATADGLRGVETKQVGINSFSSSAEAKMQNVAGLSSAEAQKSSDMYMKCRYMDELTGHFGETTEAAVKKFQELNGLAIDGVAGQQTQQKLFSSNAVPCSRDTINTFAFSWRTCSFPYISQHGSPGSDNSVP